MADPFLDSTELKQYGNVSEVILGIDGGTGGGGQGGLGQPFFLAWGGMVNSLKKKTIMEL